MAYDPTQAGAPSVTLPAGEHKFRVEAGTSYVADSGRTVWKFRCVTECEGAEVYRTYRITLGTTMTRQNLDALFDGIGKDPNDDKIAGLIDDDRVQPHHFDGREFSAMVRVNDRGYDEIHYIIPGFYRREWEAAQAKRAGRPAASAPKPPATAPAGDDIPF